MEDYVRLMALKVTARDQAEGQMEIDKEQLTPEVLFIDLLNTLGKLDGNINSVLNHARGKLTSLDPIALQHAVDQFADMTTRKRIRNWVGTNSD